MEKLTSKYRPAVLADVAGNQRIVKIIGNKLSRGIGGRCILLAGGSGSGKTTMARIIGNTTNRDNVYQINGADITVDWLDNFALSLRLKSFSGGLKVFIVDEAQGINKNIQGRMLTLIEDISDDNVVVFTTTEPEKLQPAFIGRCSLLKLERPSVLDLAAYVSKIALLEGLAISESRAKRIGELVSFTAVGNSTGYRGVLQLLDDILDSGESPEDTDLGSLIAA